MRETYFFKLKPLQGKVTCFLEATLDRDLTQNNNITYQKDLKEKMSIVNEKLAERRAFLF